MMIESLKLQNDVLKKEMILNYRTFEINQKKIAQLDKINVIEQSNMARFSPDVERELSVLYQQCNNTAPDADYEVLKKEIVDLQQQFFTTIQKANHINSQIPKTISYVNEAGSMIGFLNEPAQAETI